MLIPLGTTLQHRKQPNVTHSLIAINLVIYALQWGVGRSGGLLSNDAFVQSIAQLFEQCSLSSTHFHWYSLFTYQFLHGSWWHVIGNMIFLLPFGKAVEDRFGHFGFISFYLLSGAVCGSLHTLVSIAPVIGASGSVCAVTAAFLVLAPKTHIRVLFVFFLIGFIQIPSVLFVLFFVLIDSFGLLTNALGVNSEPTAWVVHLGGYAIGFTVAFALLKFQVVSSSEYDLPTLLLQLKRRRKFVKVFEHTPKVKSSPATPLSEEEIVRATISDLVAKHQYETACDHLQKALLNNEQFKLDKQSLTLLGNWLMSNGRVEDGCKVFEIYLKHWGDGADAKDIALLLAAKYVRTLGFTEKARDIIDSYKDKFSDKHQSLIEQLLKEIQ